MSQEPAKNPRRDVSDLIRDIVAFKDEHQRNLLGHLESWYNPGTDRTLKGIVKWIEKGRGYPAEPGPELAVDQDALSDLISLLKKIENGTIAAASDFSQEHKAALVNGLQKALDPILRVERDAREQATERAEGMGGNDPVMNRVRKLLGERGKALRTRSENFYREAGTLLLELCDALELPIKDARRSTFANDNMRGMG